MSKVVKGIIIAAVITLAIPLAAIVAPGLVTAGFVTAVNSLAIGAFLSGVSLQLAGGGMPRPSQTVEFSGTVEPRRIIYGETKVAGMNVIPPVTSGTNNKYLHQVSALAGHEVDSIGDVYFNQDIIPSASIGSVTGSSSDGAVSSGTYSGKAWIRRYLGTSSQAADYILDNALSIWTSSHQGKGVAYLAVQFAFDETAYKTGKPEVTCKVRGKKVYDPRLDSSPGANPTNPSYIAWSANPALCLADYITDSALGLGDTASRIDWAMVVTAANICDENVTVPNGSGGSTTQHRYTFNCVLYATQSYEDNIALFAGAMLGSCLYSGGRWRIKAGAWETARFQITDSNVIGNGIEVATAYPYKDRYNGVRGSFIDPNNNYQATEFPVVSNASYVTNDGEAIFKDVQFAGCTTVYEAQRNAVLLTRKSRNTMLVTVSCDMSLFKVRPGETGICTITELGWSSQLVRCEGWKFNPGGFVDLVLREELSSDWNDPSLSDYTSPTVLSNPTPVYFTPDAPSGLASTATNRGPNLTWTAPAVMPSGAVFEVWEYIASTPFSSATKVWEGVTTSAVIPKTDTTTRYYWVRVRMPDGTTGATYPASTGTAGAGAYIDTGDIASSAVTEVVTSTVAGPIDVFTSSSSYPATLVASVTVGPYAVPTTVVISVVGSVDHNAPSAQYSCCMVLSTTTLSTFSYSVDTWIARNASTTLAQDGVSFSRGATYSLSSGVTQTYYCYASSGMGAAVSGAYSKLYGVQMKAEVIKR